jgi:hypothetical protein
MNRFIRHLFYYKSDNDTQEEAGADAGNNKKINTNITYTIPPYQYNRIYAYPRGYTTQ